jgi:hypothetical protein
MADERDKKDKKDTGKRSLGTGGATETERGISNTTSVTDPRGGCLGRLKIRFRGPECADNLDSLLAGTQVNVDCEAAAYSSHQVFRGSAAGRNPCASALDAPAEVGGDQVARPEMLFLGLPAGEYTVRVTTQRGVSFARNAELNGVRTDRSDDAFYVAITGGQQTVLEINVDLSPAIVQCRAYFEGMENGKPHRRPLKGVAIYASPACGGRGECRTTDEDGATFFELAPGFHTLTASSSVRSDSDKCEFRLENDAPVVLLARPGEAGCDHGFRYVSKSGRITVCAVESGLPHRSVVALPGEVRYALLGPDGSHRCRYGSGNPARWSDLARGLYSLILLDPYLAFGERTLKPKVATGGTMQVMVCCGQDLDLSLPYAHETADVTIISGTLTDSNGNLLVGHLVRVLDACTGQTMYTTVTDQNGVYNLPGFGVPAVLQAGSDSNQFQLPSVAAPASVAPRLDQFASQQTMLMEAAPTS